MPNASQKTKRLIVKDLAMIYLVGKRKELQDLDMVGVNL